MNAQTKRILGRIVLFGSAVLLLIPLLLIATSYIFYPRDYTLDQSEDKKINYAFWIGDPGPTGPIFSGPYQYPFICTTLNNNLGQTIIDNESTGTAIFPEIFGIPLLKFKPIGFSKTCSISTTIEYYYFNTEQQRFVRLGSNHLRPKNVEMIQRNNKQIPFVVRVERGTINRFIYSIAMLAPYPESLDSPDSLDNSAWNKKLVYKFQGGMGIGHYQGIMSLNKDHALHYYSLKKGYAVAYSTGTRTKTHYNLSLAQETAMMLKKHFIAVYGNPEYTLGLGSSGGGIQQYVLAQNQPDLLDAAIPSASYPDMITQTIYVADCELLERYFDDEYVRDKYSIWGDWIKRRWIQGLVTSDKAIQKKWRHKVTPQPGSSECIHGWRGSVPLIFNPKWTPPEYIKAMNVFGFPESAQNVLWTHWGDLSYIYNRGEAENPGNSWDNVGVQYGVKALLQGKIDNKIFLDLNACIGGWKTPQEMTLGGFPLQQQGLVADPWDRINMNISEQCKSGKPAPRTQANRVAIKKAFESGQVFLGQIDIPIIDVRWYLEPVLDKHHSLSSFSTRERIRNTVGNNHQQIIWIFECDYLNEKSLEYRCSVDPISKAIEVMDRWLTQQRRPQLATDSCFDKTGTVIYAGNDAWNNSFGEGKKSACEARFPLYTTSRIEAGDDLMGIRFKCALKPVQTALHDGTYANHVFSPDEIKRLKQIFPTGVCDYSKPGIDNPSLGAGVINN